MSQTDQAQGFPQHSAHAARYYIQHHQLAPIPLPTREKKPRLAGWQSLRITAEQVETYFPANKRHNLGILNGAPSQRLVDVDLDCKEAIVAGQHLLPHTGWVFGRTSARKSHAIYRTLSTSLTKSSIKFIDPLMEDDLRACLCELRGNGSQTLFPPSLHPSGECYTWDTLHGCPDEYELPSLWLALQETAAAALLGRYWPKKGHRDDAALFLHGALVRHLPTWSVEQIARFVEVVCLVAGDEEATARARKAVRTAEKARDGAKLAGWPKLADLIDPRVVACAKRWLGLRMVNGSDQATPQAKIRVVAPFQPFPVAALPVPLRDFVREGAASIGSACDPSFVALPALVAAAGLIGNTRWLRIKRTWKEPPVLWGGIIGDSGTLKSPALSLAIDPVLEIQLRMREEYTTKRGEYEEAKAEYERKKREAEKARKSGSDFPDVGDPPEPPVDRRLVCSDTTIERLAGILQDSPQGILLWRDELDAWLSSFQRYKSGGGGSDRPQWLEMHGARSLINDRKTGDQRTIIVPHAAVSVCGGIQPGILAQAFDKGARDSGLAARVLLAWPPRTAKKWTEEELSEETEARYANLLDQLSKLEFERDGKGHARPWYLRLSPAAHKRWVEFYNEWGEIQAGVEGEVAAALAKLEGYTPRLIIVHHVVSCVYAGVDDRRDVGDKSVEAAITLVRWFAAEAQRVYSILTETDTERDGRRLVEFIRSRGGKITTRGLMRGNSRLWPDADAAEASMKMLVDAGLARWTEVASKMRGGRPIKGIELCMTHDTADTAGEEGGTGDDDEGDNLQDTVHDSDPDPSGYRSTGTGTNSTTSLERKGTCGDFAHDATGSDVSGVMRHAEGSDTEGETNPPQSEVTADATGAMHDVMQGGRFLKVPPRQSSPPYQLVQTPVELGPVHGAIADSGRVSIDVETTGLNFRTDRVRLLSVGVETREGRAFAYLVDCFAVDPSPLWDTLADKDLLLHNAVFDLAFLSRLGFTPAGKIHDLMLLSRLLTAGTSDRNGLDDLAERHLQVTLAKDYQKADWGGALSRGHLAYAAKDVAVLPPLFALLTAEIEKASLTQAEEIERRCLPAVIWMTCKGVGLDKEKWQTLTTEAEAEAERLKGELDAIAPKKPGEMFDAWNWASQPQSLEALALAGCKLEDTADETLAAANHPLAELLRKYRGASKQVSSFGGKWLKWVAEDGRVYAKWNQMGSRAGRMSCGDPNMQQLPRGKHRTCVVAPPGRVLVKADYSQIELRIAAKITGDAALLDVYRRGDDLHTRTASAVLGIKEVTKEHRQLAKALNFGLLYGMGAKTLRAYAKTNYGQDLTEGEAKRYRRAFFDAYPGLAKWHATVGNTQDKTIEKRTLGGRRRLSVSSFMERLNSPVQGTGADGLKLALALLWERREQAPGAFPVLAVHDEIVIEADADKADTVVAWLKAAMVDAMAPLIAPVPVEVEVKVGQTWGG